MNILKENEIKCVFGGSNCTCLMDAAPGFLDVVVNIATSMEFSVGYHLCMGDDVYWTTSWVGNLDESQCRIKCCDEIRAFMWVWGIGRYGKC